MSYDIFKWTGCCTSTGGEVEIVYINGSYKTKYIEPEKINIKYIEDDIAKVKYLEPNKIKVTYIEQRVNKVTYIEPPLIKVKFKC